MNWDFLVFLGVFISLIVYRLYFRIENNTSLNKIIHEYYLENNELKIVSIRKLTLIEKLRYRDTSDFIEISTFGILFLLKPTETYLRVVEMNDSKGNEFQKYIEINIRKHKIDSIFEFDTFEI